MSIWLAYLFARRFSDEKCGLLLSAIVACNYNLWLLDAQLRSYGVLDCALLALLLMTLSIYKTGQPICCHKISSLLGWAIFAAAALLGASLHVTGSLAAVCYLVLLAWLPRSKELPSRRLPCALLASSLLPSLSWFLYVKSQSENYFAKAHALGTNLREYLDLPAYLLGWQVYPYYILDLQKYLRDYPGLLSQATTWMARHINPLYAVFIVMAWILLLTGMYLALRNNWAETLLALCPALVLAAMLLTANLLSVQVLQKRHLLPLCPVLLMFISLALVSIKYRSLRNLLLITAISSMIISAVQFPYNTKLWNQHWQGAVAFLKQRCRPNDIILVYHGYACYSFAQAYAPGQMLFNPENGKLVLGNGYSEALILPFTDRLACPEFIEDVKERQVFIVLNQYRYENAKDHLFDWIINNYSLGEHYHEDSYTDWAVVDVFQLLPRQPQR
ncbi:MAG: hypothetical protein Q4F00_12365 [bacterium]|nr:hypothetical protein [bacterium]